MEDLHPESLQVCPYDSAHVVRTKRMQMHIYDCRKSHPTTEKESCPFNAAHVILAAERRWHLQTCPDRHQIHNIIVQDITPTRGCVETPNYKPVMAFEDSWDDVDEIPRNMPPPPPRPQPVASAPPRDAVSLTEEEVRGLTPRQRQQLYLRKKAEQEAAAKNPPPPLNRAPLQAQNSGMGQSRSLALFQQKVGREKKAPFDIYKDALKGSQSGKHGNRERQRPSGARPRW